MAPLLAMANTIRVCSCASAACCRCPHGVVASASASLCNGAMSTCANACSKAFAFHCDHHCDCCCDCCDHSLSIGHHGMIVRVMQILC